MRDLELPAWVYILLSTTFFTSQISAELYPFRSWVFVPLLLAAGFGPSGIGRALHFRKSLAAK